MLLFYFFRFCALVLLLAVVQSSASNVFDADARVSGGIDAAPGEFPFVVQVLLNGQHRCAGLIYNENWIVTTAVCVYGFSPSQLQVVVGQVSLTFIDPGEETLSVIAIRTHPSYSSSTKRFNVAMLQLAKPITLGVYSNPIPYGVLPTATTSGILLGWGNAGKNFQTGSISSNLRQTTVPIIDDGTCPYMNEWDYNSMICAGNNSHNACNGDAGAPLVLETSPAAFTAVGIVSHSTSCYNPTAFVRLSYYLDWFQSIGGLMSTTTTTTPITPTTTQLSSTSTIANVQNCSVSSAGQFPFIVSIANGLSGEHLCSGFIYNINHVVTTASCAKRIVVASTVINAGSLRLDSLDIGSQYDIYKIIINQESDIALIQITTEFKYSSTIKLIRIDQANYAEPSSILVGWASTEFSGCATSLDQLWGDTYLTPAAENCNWVSNFNATTMICAGALQFNSKAITESCRFESGAPLLQGNAPAIVVGIKSVVEDSCAASGQVYTAFTRLSSFVFWLQANAGLQV